MLRALFIFVLFTLAATAPSAMAEPGGGGGGGYRSKYGLDFKGFKPNAFQGVGWLGGLRTGRYIGTSNVHATVAGYYGSALGGNPSKEQVYYGGLGLGYDFRLSKVFLGEGGVLVGYGQGKLTDFGIDQISYYVIEPSFGLGFGLGNGWRLIFSASYIHMTSAQNFSGFTFGVRIDFKTQTTTRDIND